MSFLRELIRILRLLFTSVMFSRGGMTPMTAVLVVIGIELYSALVIILNRKKLIRFLIDLDSDLEEIGL